MVPSFFPVVVAEVTQPSLGVGYELGRAIALNKPVLCLFRPQSGRGEPSLPWMDTPCSPRSLRTWPLLPWCTLSTCSPRGGGGEAGWGSHLHLPRPFPVLSAMIRGAAEGSRFQVWDYDEAEVEAVLDRYFEADPPRQVASSPNPPT